MKKSFLLFSALVLFISYGNAQQQKNSLTAAPDAEQKIPQTVTPLIPLPQKTNSENRLISANSTDQFNNDIIIESDTSIDQRRVKVATAFNGWIYTAYTKNVAGNEGITIRRSKDGGFTWTDLLSSPINLGVNYPAIDLTVAGNDTNNLIVYLAGITFHQSNATYEVWLQRLTGTTGAFIDQRIDETNGIGKIYDVAIATDYRHPAYNASPYSVALVYSKLGTRDSVIYLSSIDGGATYGTREGVYSTANYCGKVAIAYGNSMYYTNGRYFVALESKSSIYANYGHVVVSHTTLDPTSTFQPPIYIDSINGSIASRLGHPRIACSNDASNNDSSNISTMVVVDRYYNPGDYDMLGLYSMASVYSTLSNWHAGVLSSGSDVEIEGDVAYNEADHFFYATFFDSTLYKLTFSETNYNNPSGWFSPNLQYNDQTNNLINPYPRLSINPVSATANFVWNSEGTNGKGVALFDAQSNPTGIPLAGNSYDFQSPYPNPSDGKMNFRFALESNEDVRISITNSIGQEIIPVTEFGIQSAGMHNLPVDFSTLPNGVYIFRFMAGNVIKTGNLVIAH